MKFRNDCGRSMIEMILYLGLIVVLTASTLRMYADSVEKTRNIKLETIVDELKEDVNTYYLGRPLPSDWNKFITDIGGSAKVVDPWGGKITILTGKEVADTVYSKANFGFKISGKAIDTKRCINIGNIFISKGAFAVKVNSDDISGVNLEISSIAAACKSDDNTVEGYFYKD